MTLESFTIFFGWFAAAAFIGVSAFKIVKVATMPLNLRWEVYPVPHEAEAKRGYGGSYMEDVDWTKKPRAASIIPEFVEMGAEIFALKKVKTYNVYGIWVFSMAMHWGIYLYFGWLLLLVVDNLIPIAALDVLTTVVGLASFILGTFGSLALVVKRTTSADLHLYTAPIDYFNLLFIAAFFVVSLVSWLTHFSFAAHKAYIGSVLFLKPTAVPFTVLLGFALFELFMVYMPFTKLIHYFAKYFTFHHSLWDDEYNAKGSATDRKIVQQMAYRVNWSGPHIVADKTWLEQAQNALTESEKK